MSLNLPTQADLEDRDGEDSDILSESDEDDPNWDCWNSDSLIQRACKSLFEEKLLPSAEETLEYDKVFHRFDLNGVCSKLSLDFHGRIRLINYIRKTKQSPENLVDLTGNEPFFTSDEYLVPALEDDPLLQVQPDNWSDSEGEDAKAVDPVQKIRKLERKLADVQQNFIAYRTIVSQKFNSAGLLDPETENRASRNPIPLRDDDSHYFKSYGEHDIHAIMIQDKVRTSTYAHFILTHPMLFDQAVVLDVGCGTGILSLFAARSGAKRVIAVDASDIAEKAQRIVDANNFGDVITVIQGKIEEITLPEGIEKVDIIISEWMGYALLYESMLDSVIHARDRFLRSGGIMAPSQCRMMLGLCDASEVIKDRIEFWNDVYGFDFSVMTADLYNEAIVDIAGPDTMLSEPYVVKDLILGEVAPRHLNFITSFTLISTAERRTKVNAFVLYFDVFFNPLGQPVPVNTEVNVINSGDVIVADVWPVGGRPASQRRRSSGFDRNAITSFSTGPKSAPTHWKQTLFVLRQPFDVSEGSIVQGSFYCSKSQDNLRELCVEIHYSVKRDPGGPASNTVVQMFNVR